MARLRVTLRKSPISYTARARGTLRALGLHRIGQTVEIDDNPMMRGMTRAVSFLVEVQEAESGDQASASKTPRRRSAAAKEKADR
jgi:large subunit ribosomal protein L30